MPNHLQEEQASRLSFNAQNLDSYIIEEAGGTRRRCLHGVVKQHLQRLIA